MLFNESKKQFRQFQEYLESVILDKLKNTPYEDDEDTFETILNNVYSEYDEMMFNDIKVNDDTYFDLLDKELISLGIV